MASSFEIVQPATVPTEQFNTCETEVRKLTDPLGCTEMRVNQVIVEPGSVTTPHTHDGQGEVFVATTGGQIAVEGDLHDVPEAGSSASTRTRSGISVTILKRHTLGSRSVHRPWELSRTSGTTSSKNEPRRPARQPSPHTERLPSQPPSPSASFNSGTTSWRSPTTA